MDVEGSKTGVEQTDLHGKELNQTSKQEYCPKQHMGELMEPQSGPRG